MKRRLHFVVVAVDGCIASTIYAPIELMQLCRSLQAALPELEPFDVSTELLSPNGEPFLCSSGYRLPVDGGLKRLPGDTVIFIPGFGLPAPDRIPALLEQHESLGAWLKQQHRAGSTIVASCTGSFLLAEAGVFTKRASTYWLYADLFRQRYPLIGLDVDTNLLVEGRVFSVGGGAVCGIEAVLAVVERLIGKGLSRLCTKMLLLEDRKPSQLRYEKRQPTMHNDRLVERAVTWIRENLHAKLTIEDLLRQVPTSRRNLSRRFKTETGEGVQAFIQRLRMDRAKLLLETSSLPIEQILDQIGYRDASAFARQFKRHTQLTPNLYRQRYGLTEGARLAPAASN